LFLLLLLSFLQDAEIANMRKLTVTKLDEKKTDYEYRQASEQLNKMSLNLQDVSTELSKALQENSRLQSKITSMEAEVSLSSFFLSSFFFIFNLRFSIHLQLKTIDSTRTGIAEQSFSNQKRVAALEDEMKQKVAFLHFYYYYFSWFFNFLFNF
jgi:hypothetical protein